MDLLTKDNGWGKIASDLCRTAFPDMRVWFNSDEALSWGKNDVLVSFLYSKILPASVIKAHRIAINFHPGSTDYPGTGCYNFALYEGASEYGAVAHHMEARPDTGAVIEERRFKLTGRETVEQLQTRTLSVMLSMLHDIVFSIQQGEQLPSTGHSWTRKPFTRKQLDDLCILTPEMDSDEAMKRIRATSFPGKPGARVRVHGEDFFLTG